MLMTGVVVAGTGVGVSTAKPLAAASTTFHWSTPKTIDMSMLTSLSCPSTLLCVGSDYAGRTIWSSNPAGGVESWSHSSSNVTDTGGFAGVSCPTASFCVGIGANAGDEGFVFTTTHPQAKSATAWSKADVDGRRYLTSVDCVPAATRTFCIASDRNGAIFTSSNPAGGRSAWSKADVDGSTHISAVSCNGSKSCMLVDTAGFIWESTHPSGGAREWSKVLDQSFGPFDAVSCPLSSTLTTCFVVGKSGSDGSVSFHGGFIASSGDPNNLLSLSCPSSHLCIAGDNAHNVLVNGNPLSSSAYHRKAVATSTAAIAPISCPSTTLCVAVAGKQAVVGRAG